ncbi:hypothetical protein L227DRAFT_596583 [Lentinus tigrinus ALCF2SS1-6]|uniref:Uncharacterized protein n=1 Tax=Lentinus tigrinus ALCF2SS1-6 TaxID=1328759 RepID=A0A5C2RND2_9APHY|nr:hypothetical protein L227DRAFT_596583 [Lentinus tigrinus ALCF2SS1-6]
MLRRQRRAAEDDDSDGERGLEGSFKPSNKYLGPVPHDASYATRTSVFSRTPLAVTKQGSLERFQPHLRQLLAPGTGDSSSAVSTRTTYMNFVGEEASAKYKGAIWLAGSASAEFCADIVLCPLKMTKMSKFKTETRYPFSSLIPLISYAMAKFFFECIVGLFCKHIFAAMQLGVIFASGYLAAVVSHPALTPVADGQEPRCERLINDLFKTAMGIGTTGGK